MKDENRGGGGGGAEMLVEGNARNIHEQHQHQQRASAEPASGSGAIRRAAEGRSSQNTTSTPGRRAVSAVGPPTTSPAAVNHQHHNSNHTTSKPYKQHPHQRQHPAQQVTPPSSPSPSTVAVSSLEPLLTPPNEFAASVDQNSSKPQRGLQFVTQNGLPLPPSGHDDDQDSDAPKKTLRRKNTPYPISAKQKQSIFSSLPGSKLLPRLTAPVQVNTYVNELCDLEEVNSSSASGPLTESGHGPEAGGGKSQEQDAGGQNNLFDGNGGCLLIEDTRPPSRHPAARRTSSLASSSHQQQPSVITSKEQPQQAGGGVGGPRRGIVRHLSLKSNEATPSSPQGAPPLHHHHHHHTSASGGPAGLPGPPHGVVHLYRRAADFIGEVGGGRGSVSCNSSPVPPLPAGLSHQFYSSAVSCLCENQLYDGHESYSIETAGEGMPLVGGGGRGAPPPPLQLAQPPSYGCCQPVTHHHHGDTSGQPFRSFTPQPPIPPKRALTTPSPLTTYPPPQHHHHGHHQSMGTLPRAFSQNGGCKSLSPIPPLPMRNGSIGIMHRLHQQQQTAVASQYPPAFVGSHQTVTSSMLAGLSPIPTPTPTPSPMPPFTRLSVPAGGGSQGGSGPGTGSGIVGGLIGVGGSRGEDDQIQIFPTAGSAPTLPTYRSQHGAWRRSVPFMPLFIAFPLCILNIFLPGTGTVCASITILFGCRTEWGRSHRARAFTLCFLAGVIQMVTAIGVVGWVWSIMWGITFCKNATRFTSQKYIINHIILNDTLPFPAESAPVASSAQVTTAGAGLPPRAAGAFGVAGFGGGSLGVGGGGGRSTTPMQTSSTPVTRPSSTTPTP